MITTLLHLLPVFNTEFPWAASTNERRALMSCHGDWIVTTRRRPWRLGQLGINHRYHDNLQTERSHWSFRTRSHSCLFKNTQKSVLSLSLPSYCSVLAEENCATFTCNNILQIENIRILLQKTHWENKFITVNCFDGEFLVFIYMVFGFP